MSPWFLLIVVPVAVLSTFWLVLLVVVIWASETPPHPDQDNWRY